MFWINLKKLGCRYSKYNIYSSHSRFQNTDQKNQSRLNAFKSTAGLWSVSHVVKENCWRIKLKREMYIQTLTSISTGVFSCDDSSRFGYVRSWWAAGYEMQANERDNFWGNTYDRQQQNPPNISTGLLGWLPGKLMWATRPAARCAWRLWLCFSDRQSG